MATTELSESMAQPSDAQLFYALRSGERTAMVSLYRRYASVVYGLALSILKNPQEAEDLSQEIFLSLWRGGGYNPERGSLSSYLMLLTRSRALDKLRARGRKLKMVERVGQVNLGEPSGVTPLERATVDECCERVREAVASLPLKERQVLELSVFGGLSYPQIAAQTGTPLGTIKRWARKGMLQLKEDLKALIE
ncbi:sigma-70 family RNA polymerase sigma factor [Gloeobacter morelensis]|uniref:Sigma-70 family RNA polymerase sigma factor n=1 Tax=Gloeobacter morelensis MG652769 TaxID=2781736 RepID=A0ABY3PQ69_9CYAN|nr:sigma-70 family RNA polymerase sigma factor [Gloeobacter morelensis]UFP95790.1 sigma-70 family RNA polymerase sigma factor [Gloeobacter morelensis MG652769]